MNTTAVTLSTGTLEDTDLDAEAIVRRAMGIAAEICVYTNGNLVIESLETA